MYLNTIESIELGSKIHFKYGSWKKARAKGAVKNLTYYEIINRGRHSKRIRRNKG